MECFSIMFLMCVFFCTDAFAGMAGIAGNKTPLTATAETVTANLATTTTTIPATFVGWSQEETDVVNGGLFTGANTSLISLMGLLGSSGNLRIGGNTQDSLTLPPLTQTIANGVQAFVSGLGSGWQVSWGLDGKINSSSSAVTHAGYLINAFGVGNVIFSLDNEPDEWAGFTSTTFVTLWNNYYAALTTAYPSILIEGTEPAFCTNQTAYTTGLTPPLSALQYITCHSYPGGSPTKGSHDMVSKSNSLDGSTFQQSNITAANGLWRLGEFGMDFSLGISGIVDRLTSSAYYLNLAMNIASHGGIGLNPHSASTAPMPTWNSFYQQLDGNYAPAPIFYGMFMMSHLSGQLMATTTKSGTGTINAISTVGTHGNANMLIVNNDVANPVVITPAQSNSWTTAKVLVVAPSSNAQGCADQSPTVGGVAIGESGAWSGGFSSISNGGTVLLQPCGSVLVEFQP